FPLPVVVVGIGAPGDLEVIHHDDGTTPVGEDDVELFPEREILLPVSVEVTKHILVGYRRVLREAAEDGATVSLVEMDVRTGITQATTCEGVIAGARLGRMNGESRRGEIFRRRAPERARLEYGPEREQAPKLLEDLSPERLPVHRTAPTLFQRRLEVEFEGSDEVLSKEVFGDGLVHAECVIEVREPVSGGRIYPRPVRRAKSLPYPSTRAGRALPPQRRPPAHRPPVRTRRRRRRRSLRAMRSPLRPLPASASRPRSPDAAPGSAPRSR